MKKKLVHFQILKRTNPRAKKTALRFILAKSIYRPKDLKEYDVILMNELYLSLADDMVRNESWFLKNKRWHRDAGQRLIFVNHLFEKNFCSKLSTRKHFFQESDFDFSEPLSPRAFRGLEADASFQRQLGRMLRIGREELVRHEQKHIGVGYKDKGARRDPSKDGSPSWQEVAMTRKKMKTNDDWKRLWREIETSEINTEDDVEPGQEFPNQPRISHAKQILDFVVEANAPAPRLEILCFGKIAANDEVFLAELD